MKVRANIEYRDTLLKRIVNKDEVLEVDEARAKVLTTKEWYGQKFASIVEETVEEVAEEKPKKKRTKKAE